jgi:predicted ABC-type ATPase
MLDAQYHGFYRPSRQLTQDQIISYVLRSSGSIQRQRTPWIVFTAGAMGSGKSRTMRMLSERFSQLEQFCLIDQDEIRSLLPEWAQLSRKPASSSSTNAASLLQKESGYLSEISLEECLLASRSIVFDSSLRDGAWWASEFYRILTAYPQYRIAIMYVQTDIHTALARSESRAKLCGRDVPVQHVVDSFHQSRASFEQLKGMAHMSIVVDSTDAYPRAVDGDIAAFCSSLR